MAQDVGSIRFVSTPTGGAPEWVRESWVGVEVPCLFFLDSISCTGGVLCDVVSGLVIPDYPGYIVYQAQAIAALEKTAPEAAEYWRSLGYPENGPSAMFLFDEESAIVVNPVMTLGEFLSLQ